jgi:molybdopterin converting factor small subunit
MNITVKVGAPLSTVIGTKHVRLSMPEGTHAGHVLDELHSRYPRFAAGLQGEGLPRTLASVPYSLFLNARHVPFERAAHTPLRDGDRLYLFLPVAGG